MKVITIYELLGLIKDGKEKITFRFKDEIYNAEQIMGMKLMRRKVGNCYVPLEEDVNIWDVLNDEIEILEDEEEFENIEELKLRNGEYHSKRHKQDVPISMTEEELIMQVNQLIRNQKKIIDYINKGDSNE